MIVERECVTKEEYEAFKDQFYGEVEEKPETEIELFGLQERMLLDHDEQAFEDMKKLLTKYVRSLFLKRVKGSQEYIDPADIDEMSGVAAEGFMARFTRDPKFVVGASFAGMLRWKVVEGLSKYHKAKGLEVVSLDQEIRSIENKTVGDMIEDQTVDVESFLDYDKAESFMAIVEEICDKIDAYDIEGFESKDFLVYLLYLFTYFKSTEETGKSHMPLASVSELILSMLKVPHNMVAKYESAFLDIYDRMRCFYASGRDRSGFYENKTEDAEENKTDEDEVFEDD